MRESIPSFVAAQREPSQALSSGEESEEGRALLQNRLALFGKFILFVDVLYYPLFQLSLSFDPSLARRPLTNGGFSLLSEMGGELFVFGGFWLLCYFGRRSLRTLYLIDTIGTLLFSTVFSLWPFIHPYPLLGSYEGLLSLVLVLNLRATLVPSTVWRTLVLNASSGLIGLCALYAAAVQRDMLSPTSTTLLLLGFTWYVVALLFSTLTSSVIYGLRQQVKDAQRLGQYVLLRHLGSGTMGRVFLARHAMLRRDTAVKLLNAGAGTRGLWRFEREVQLTSQLSHPNIIIIYDYGRTTDGFFYYAMEYLDGVDLEGLLAADGPQPPARVIHILRQVCSALELAHAQGLLHRDIKPANLFLCRQHGPPDTVKVLDFGLVKELGRPQESVLTYDGMLVGTPLYLSPEAIASPTEVDGRSDLYSLGAVGYWLLTGRPVFEGRNVMEICAHHLHTPPIHPSVRLGTALPEDLCQIILRCLQKQPEDRLMDARTLREHLDVCADAWGWTEPQAQRWWKEHGSQVEQVYAQRSKRDLSGTQTLSADLAERAA